MTPDTPARLHVPTDHPVLARLGWDAAWAAVAGPAATALRLPSTVHLRVARVVRADRGGCDVLGETAVARTTWGADVVAATAGDPTAVPAAGDWVVVASWPDGRTTTEAVLPRRTAVVRAQVAAGSTHGQVLAANADVVAVVEGMDPDPDPGRLERLLALAWSSGARPLVVLTKADLVSDPLALVAEVGDLAPGCEVLATAVTDGGEAPGGTGGAGRAGRAGGAGDAGGAAHGAAGAAGAGLAALRGLLEGGATLALLGASGVGKSTLLNALVGEAAMATRGLRADGKGRHTTVTRELHLAPSGGSVLDTPGLRTVGLLGREAVDEVFPDVEVLAERCRFADCAHDTEPGCAVQAAIADGDLPERRLASYRKLGREVEWQASRTDARLRAERARVWRQRTAHNRRTVRARP